MKFKNLNLNVKLLFALTVYMSYRLIGGALNLFWIISENERAASGDWMVAFGGDTVIGLLAMILGYKLIKNPSSILWSFILCWNAIGAFDIVGALSGTVFSPFAPFPELGIGYCEFQIVLASNLIIHTISFYLLFRKDVKAYLGTSF